LKDCIHCSGFLPHRYDIPQLKEVAKEKFETAAKACWQMDDFPVAIAEVYSDTLETDRGLRDLLVTISTDHIDQLQEENGFRRALESMAGFATDLALNLAQGNAQISKRTKYRCPGCTTKWFLELSEERCNTVQTAVIPDLTGRHTSFTIK
jgi:hypothetical protein